MASWDVSARIASVIGVVVSDPSVLKSDVHSTISGRSLSNPSLQGVTCRKIEYFCHSFLFTIIAL